MHHIAVDSSPLWLHVITSFTGSLLRSLVCAAIFMILCHFIVNSRGYFFLISIFWEYFPIEIHMSAPVKRALQYIC